MLEIALKASQNKNQLGFRVTFPGLRPGQQQYEYSWSIIFGRNACPPALVCDSHPKYGAHPSNTPVTYQLSENPAHTNTLLQHTTLALTLSTSATLLPGSLLALFYMQIKWPQRKKCNSCQAARVGCQSHRTPPSHRRQVAFATAGRIKFAHEKIWKTLRRGRGRGVVCVNLRVLSRGDVAAVALTRS